MAITPRRGENEHHLVIQEIEMHVPETEGAGITYTLIAVDEHYTVYRFDFNLQLIDEHQVMPR